MKILFTGGGTGGHVFPIIAIVREMKRIQLEEGRGDFEFFYIGPKDEFSSVLLGTEGIKVKTIVSGKIRRYLGVKSILENFIDIFFKIPLGIIRAFFHIFFLAPDIIFSKGGYGSIPAVIAAWFLATPIFLHESDIVPGLANRILGRFALEIFISFPRTEYFPPKKMVLVGNPIRKEMLKGSRKEGKRFFKLTGEKPAVLVLGGSQGAQRINDMLLADLPRVLRDFELIHQCGENNFNQVEAESKVVLPREMEKYYHLVPFLKEPELLHAYAACDVVVSRAGSGSIFEIAACGKPSILIPLSEAAQQHQLKNAYAYSEFGACLVLEEPNLNLYFLLERLINMCLTPGKLKKMGDAAREFSRPQAARIVAGYIADYLS